MKLVCLLPLVGCILSAPPKVFFAVTPMSIRNSAYSDIVTLVYSAQPAALNDMRPCRPHTHHALGAVNKRIVLTLDMPIQFIVCLF